MMRWLALAVLGALLWATDGSSHFQPGRHNAVHAIQQTWCGKANRTCWQGNEAIAVAKCESSDLWWWARNRPAQAVGPRDERGIPRKGMFQLGSYERGICGHGPDPWAQARAARCWQRKTGDDWGAWECQP